MDKTYISLSAIADLVNPVVDFRLLYFQSRHGGTAENSLRGQ